MTVIALASATVSPREEPSAISHSPPTRKPSVLVGASYTGFGGGRGGHVGSFHDRGDFEALAVREVRNFGFGERAARNVAAARREYLRAVADYDKAQFRFYRSLGWPIR